MNNDRRATVKAAAALIAAGAEQIREGRDLLDGVKDEEKEALDAMPEGLKSGERGQEMEAAVSHLEETVDALDCIGFGDIGRALEEATGKDVAELPEGKLTKAEAEQRRRDRLPEWAKTEMARLECELASVREQAREVYPEPGPDSFTVEDHFSPHNGRALPFERITLRGITIQAEDGREGITLHAGGGGGSLVVVPHVSNTISVEVRRYR